MTWPWAFAIVGSIAAVMWGLIQMAKIAAKMPQRDRTVTFRPTEQNQFTWETERRFEPKRESDK